MFYTCSQVEKTIATVLLPGCMSTQLEMIVAMQYPPREPGVLGRWMPLLLQVYSLGECKCVMYVASWVDIGSQRPVD